MSHSVNPIPKGYHSVSPSLVIRGAAEAIAFYTKVFDATEVSRMMFPGKPLIAHAEIRIGNSMLMLSDENSNWGAFSPQHLNGSPVTLFLYVADVDAVFAKATAAGVNVVLPPTDMFWGDRMCKILDPFGHVWGVATHTKDLSVEEITKAGDEFMSKMSA